MGYVGGQGGVHGMGTTGWVSHVPLGGGVLATPGGGVLATLGGVLAVVVPPWCPS